MVNEVRRYTSDNVDVTYDAQRCIHAAECVRGLAAVFDTAKRPWIQPANGDADTVAEVVMRCPTGALHFDRKDGGAAEPVPNTNRIVVTANGPLYAHGDVEIEKGDETFRDTRLALCRCGQSNNKPFCDNAHKEAGFADAGQFPASETTDTFAKGRLHIAPTANGPLLLNGNFALVSADGKTIFQGEKAALCRCGASGNKPFCDGTHKAINFSTEMV